MSITLKTLYENRGTKFYYNMPTVDFVVAFTSVPYLYNMVKEAPDIVKLVSDAQEKRQEAEYNLKQAIEELKQARLQTFDINQTLIDEFKDFNQAVIDEGQGATMVASGPGPHSHTVYTDLGVKLTQAAKKIKDDQTLYKHMTDEIPKAKQKVADMEAALAAAIEAEKKAVNDGIDFIVSTFI